MTKSNKAETESVKMKPLTSLRGMHDILPDQMHRHRAVIDKARHVAASYGFQEMATPLLEPLEVFVRTLGETTDIVTKEMYHFQDKNGDDVTLRPENTASVMRAFANHGLQQHGIAKFFYAGPMFRYERPQKGRLRQFHQIGIEAIGPASAQADIEAIACGFLCLKALGIADLTVLNLNSLGNTTSRAAYRDALVAYFSDHIDSLSDESRERLHRNPLRILDSKSKQDQKLVEQVPLFDDYMDAESKDFFDEVKAGLDNLGIHYRLNRALVRGLDYYCHTAFEFITDELGAQGTVLGGGRYDGLAEFMGFSHVPAVGWAAGIERLAMLIDAPPPPARAIMIIPIGADAQAKAMQLAHHMRIHDLYVELNYSNGNIGKRLKQATKLNARFALILGDDELANNSIQLRDLDRSTQLSINQDQLIERINHLSTIEN